MINIIKKGIISSFRKLGLNISKVNSYTRTPFEDFQFFLPDTRHPVIFDIGANKGQSINSFRKQFSDSIIYSFEPGTKAFNALSQNFKGKKDIYLNNIALGSKIETKTLKENTISEMSSLLDIGQDGWGEIKQNPSVKVVTIDQFCQDNKIANIDVLKCDTQGYELEVFKGAIEMMKMNKIPLIYFEFIFSDMYKGLPSFADVYQFLTDNNFRLVKTYKEFYQNNLISWTDMLFINIDHYNNLSKNNKI